MDKLSIGDVVRISSEGLWRITDLQGISKLFPNDYKAVNVEHGEVGLIHPNQVKEVISRANLDVGWEGEGYPPVGTVCIINGGLDYDAVDKEYKILAYGKHEEDDAVLVSEWVFGSCGIMSGFICKYVEFKPLKTGRMKWVEKAHTVWMSSEDTTYNLLGRIYDEMVDKSGTEGDNKPYNIHGEYYECLCNK